MFLDAYLYKYMWTIIYYRMCWFIFIYPFGSLLVLHPIPALYANFPDFYAKLPHYYLLCVILCAPCANMGGGGSHGWRVGVLGLV